MGHRLLRLASSRVIRSLEELLIVLQEYPSVWDDTPNVRKAVPSRWMLNRPLWEVSHKLNHFSIRTVTPAINDKRLHSIARTRGIRRAVLRIDDDALAKSDPRRNYGYLGGQGVPVVFTCGHKGRSFSRKLRRAANPLEKGSIHGRCLSCRKLWALEFQ